MVHGIRVKSGLHAAEKQTLNAQRPTLNAEVAEVRLKVGVRVRRAERATKKKPAAGCPMAPK